MRLYYHNLKIKPGKKATLIKIHKVFFNCVFFKVGTEEAASPVKSTPAPSETDSPVKHVPRKLISLQYNSDSDDEETKEERRARIVSVYTFTLLDA